MKKELIIKYLKDNNIQEQNNIYDNLISIQFYTELNQKDMPNFELSTSEYIKLVLKKLKYNIQEFKKQYGSIISSIIIKTITRIVTRRTTNYLIDQFVKKRKERKKVQKGGQEQEIIKFKKPIDKLSKNIIIFINKTKNVIKN